MSLGECMAVTPNHTDLEKRFLKWDERPLSNGPCTKLKEKLTGEDYKFSDFLDEKRRHQEKLQINVSDVEDTKRLEHICFLERKEFPSFDYVLEESENALSEMHPIVDDLKRIFIEELPSLKDPRLPTLLREICNEKFGGNRIILSIIGKDFIPSIADSLTVNWQRTSFVCHKPHLYTISLCIQDNIQDEEVLGYLQNLSNEDLEKVIFLSTDGERIQNILAQSFPDTVSKVPKFPTLATWRTLKTVVSDVLTERLFGILEFLLNALQYLSKTSNETKEYIENAIEDIESLLRERPGTNAPKLNCINEDIRKKLSRLKEKGVNGCCLYGEELIVFADSDHKDTEKLREEINIFASKQVQNVIIHSGKCPLYKSQITDGDKIIPQRELNKDKRFGTIGTFVLDERKRKIGLTAGHVAYKNEHVFTGDEALLGTCKEVSDQTQENAANLAVIEVHQHALSKCKERTTGLVLFGSDKREIVKGQRVHKIGAKTGKTVGVIVTEFASNDHPGDFLVVKGLHGKPFSEGGDSGSVVYMRNLGNDKDVAIAMVTAGEDSKDKSIGAEGENEFDHVYHEIDNWTYTFMLKKEIDELERRGCTLKFS